jgi:hypothetical protein
MADHPAVRFSMLGLRIAAIPAMVAGSSVVLTGPAAAATSVRTGDAPAR